MATKKVKVKVKKKKLNRKRTLITFIFLISLILLVAYIINLPVKNIYITGNNILSDKEIIKISELENYPAYINTYFSNIKENLLKHDYIKNVKKKENYLVKSISKLKNINHLQYIKIN